MNGQDFFRVLYGFRMLTLIYFYDFFGIVFCEGKSSRLRKFYRIVMERIFFAWIIGGCHFLKSCAGRSDVRIEMVPSV